MDATWFPGRDIECKRTLYDATQAALDASYWKPYVDICAAETPGFDYEERLEPKYGMIAQSLKNRPRDVMQPQAFCMRHRNAEDVLDDIDSGVDRHNEALAA